MVEQRGSRKTTGRTAGRQLIHAPRSPAARVAWHSSVIQNSRLLRAIVLGTPLLALLPWGLIPWRVCREWKKWENQERSRHISSPGSDHVTQRPRKGFPSLADLWSKATSQELGTLRKFSLSDIYPTSWSLLVGMSHVLLSIHPLPLGP